jgi:hypothetical protein
MRQHRHAKRSEVSYDKARGPRKRKTVGFGCASAHIYNELERASALRDGSPGSFLSGRAPAKGTRVPWTAY